MLSSCCSFCREEKTQLLPPLMNSEYFLPYLIQQFRISCTMDVFIMSVVNEVQDRINQGASHSRPRLLETSDASSDESDTGKGYRKFLPEKTFKIKKVYAASWLRMFFVTGPTDAANNSSHFFSGLSKKCLFPHSRAPRTFFSISNGLATLPGTDNCALTHLGGVRWISTEIISIKTNCSKRMAD